MAATEVLSPPVERGAPTEVFPDIFNLKAKPPQPKQPKPGQLPDHMIKQFFEDVRCLLFKTMLNVTNMYIQKCGFKIKF